jgi:hypothetical protein
MAAKVGFEDIKINFREAPYFLAQDRNIGFTRSCWVYDYEVSFDGIKLLFAITVPNDGPEDDRDLMSMPYLKTMIAVVAKKCESCSVASIFDCINPNGPLTASTIGSSSFSSTRWRRINARIAL